jgi:tetratricopeptide (TPR) repeat protein
MKAAIFCKGCKTSNTSDSKFCKLCGAKIEVTSEIKPEDAEKLLKDGFELVADGHAEEALFLAEAVLDANPANASAYALKAMCHEERGEVSLAIASQQEVVRLNPDSTLDRIKLAQLKRQEEPGVHDSDLEVRERNWVAIFSAVAAAVVVGVLGIALAMNNERSAAAKPDQRVAARVAPPAPEAFASPAKQPTSQPDAPPTNAPAATEPSRNPVVGNPMNSTPPLTLNIRPENGGLPDVRIGGSTPTTPKPSTASGPEASVTRADPNLIEQPERKGPGRIVIEESRGGANPGDASVSENIYRVAQQKMANGDYRGAIRDFAASLAGSRKPGLIHQLMGRCYARIGESANAKQHFQSALQIYEQAGNENEAKACRREIELLAG